MSETVNKTGELANAVYKNVKMGSELIMTVMPKVEDQSLKSEITEQLANYEKYASKVKKLIVKSGDCPKEESAFSKFMAKMGVQMNTMTDSTSSHIAEMMIQGSTMNITDLLRKIHEIEVSGDAGGDEVAIAEEIVGFEEQNVERLKRYL